MHPIVLENPAIREHIVRLNLDQYHVLCESGRLDAKTELFDGLIVRKRTKGTRHSYFSYTLAELLRPLTPDKAILRTELPLSIDRSELEPDLSVVDGPAERYLETHPTTALLVVEIADTSLSYDREKAAIYARADVPTYMILNVHEANIEVYSEPREGGYTAHSVLRAPATLPLLSGELDLAKLF